MKKTILTIAAVITALFTANTLSAQWTSKTINNGVDDPYRVAFCSALGNTAILKLEWVESTKELAFYVSGGYCCDDKPIVDVVFIVNGEKKKYQFTGETSSNKKTVFILDDIRSTFNYDFLTDFEASSSVIVRVVDSVCDSEVYGFSMGGSSKAIAFMTPKDLINTEQKPTP